ncbi:MAG: phosphoribosylanthranilate isomerase [Dysgonomonas sp.]
MIIKVCGMKNPDNIKELGQLPIDYMGMIFYEKSPRFVDRLTESDLQILPKDIKRVGVFVNAGADYIKAKIKEYNLDFIQLHGGESPEFCAELNKIIPVVKAFSVSEIKDLEKTEAYEGTANLFLFDTKTPQYGGSGQKFDWNILNEYKGTRPFLLSGGISADDAESIKAIRHPQFYGIDLNSKFELEAGLKDIQLLQQFIKALNDEQD